ncbi:MAG: tetratricopeptide repeat protein [Kofleriaceae bacterium]
MTARWTRRLGVAALLAAAVAGCVDSERLSRRDRADERSVTRLADPSELAAAEVPVDEALLVALAQAKNFHHKARVYMGDGNPQAAIEAVRQVLSVTFPAGAPEGVEVGLDARALLAKLLAGEGRLDEAMAEVSAGLASDPPESFFLANLYTVLGELHQARAEVAADPAGAAAERRAAIGALDRSIAINLEIQRRLGTEATP